jgi:hypothetical protein
LDRKHEQDQHNKDISDLVQGIAAGNLWKRRSGQVDDLDLFDEEDMVGRFHMKKKLKVTESFEKLGRVILSLPSLLPALCAGWIWLSRCCLHVQLMKYFLRLSYFSGQSSDRSVCQSLSETCR